MNKEKVIDQIAEKIRSRFDGDSSGHDWWHIYRVWQTARTIGEEENADLLVVELGALLHDIADYKFHDGDETIAPKMTREILEENSVPEEIINEVIHIVKHVSFKGAKVDNKMESLEGKVVQDADRLDAIGAMGIGRTFAYGGHKGREMYNPERKPVLHKNSEKYKSNTSPTINHFYEKLLLLKDMMNTQTGKRLAEQRHKFMENYLEQFFVEWEGKR